MLKIKQHVVFNFVIVNNYLNFSLTITKKKLKNYSMNNKTEHI